eukprot:CFRG3629T1
MDYLHDFADVYIGDISYEKRTMTLLGLGVVILAVLSYITYHMEDDVANQRKQRGPAAPPQPRPSLPVRTYNSFDLIPLNILYYTLAICSLVILIPGAMGMKFIFTNYFDWDAEHYGLAPHSLDIVANGFFILLSIVAFLSFLYPVYINHKIMAYGTETEGTVSMSVSDYTISVFIFPASRIEWTYKPAGGQRLEDGLWKSTPFSTWARNNFKNGSKITVLYDPAHPHHSISPTLVDIKYTNIIRKTQ